MAKKKNRSKKRRGSADNLPDFPVKHDLPGATGSIPIPSVKFKIGDKEYDSDDIEVRYEMYKNMPVLGDILQVIYREENHGKSPSGKLSETRSGLVVDFARRFSKHPRYYDECLEWLNKILTFEWFTEETEESNDN